MQLQTIVVLQVEVDELLEQCGDKAAFIKKQCVIIDTVISVYKQSPEQNTNQAALTNFLTHCGSVCWILRHMSGRLQTPGACARSHLALRCQT